MSRLKLSTKSKRLPQIDENISSVQESDDIFGSDSENQVEKDVSAPIVDDSLFSKILSDCGFILKHGDTANVLGCDQVSFQRSVSKAIRNAGFSSTAATEFGKGLEDYISLPHNLKWALLYTSTDPNCESSHGTQQDSLLRILLNIDSLQPTIINLITDTLLKLAYETEENDSSLPSLALGNLRWLDHIVDPKLLTEKLLMVLTAATPIVQKDIIYTIPDILPDEFHPEAAKSIIELYDSTPSLCPTILDALLHMSLPDDTISELHNTVLSSLQAAHPSHLPCILKFLLNNTSSSDAYKVLFDVRQKLHIPADDSSDMPTLIFATIKSCLLLKKFLTGAWLKTIVDASSLRNCDLWVLFLAHDNILPKRKVIQSILRNKIRAGLQYDFIVRKAFEDNPSLMQEFFKTIQKISAVMLRSNIEVISDFGCSLYKVTFECCISSSTRCNSLLQESVSALLCHLGDVNYNARYSSLKLLSKLTHHHTATMARFAMILKSSMEQLDRLTIQESRCLLDSVCAVAEFAPNTVLNSELAIFTRKMLNNDDIRYKRLGVLSAVLTLKNSNRDEDDSMDMTQHLDMVRSCTANNPSASALFMDELAATILRDDINITLERWLSSKLEETFEEMFIQDLESDRSSYSTAKSNVEMSLQFNAEDSDSPEIALNIGMLIENLELASLNPKDSSKSIVLTLCSHFRLLRMVVCHLNSGDLSAVDGLLGCPIYYPSPYLLSPDTFKTLKNDQKSVILSTLFFTANWFRELINAFATQKTTELKKKVYLRLRHLLEVEKTLSQLLPFAKSYCPHIADTHLDPQSTKTKIKNKGSSSSKVTNEAIPCTSDDMPATLPTQIPSTKRNTPEEVLIDLSSYKPYIRELNLDVFNLLFKTLSCDIKSVHESNKLNLPEIEFLLTDFIMKLNHVYSGSKRSTAFGNVGTDKDAGFRSLDLFTTEEIAIETQKYVKPICVHLKQIATFFKSLIDDHDGEVPDSDVFTEEVLAAIRVQGLLLSALHQLFNWSALYSHHDIYTVMFHIICRKFRPDLNTEDLEKLNTDELIWGAFCYTRKELDAVLEIDNALLVIKVLESLVNLAKMLNIKQVTLEREDEENQESYDLSNEFCDTIQSVLERKWPCNNMDRKKKIQFNKKISELLSLKLVHNSSPLKVIEDITNKGFVDSEESDLCTLNKNTLNMYFNSLMSVLPTSVKKQLSNATVSNEQHELDTWLVAVNIFSQLFKLTKKHHPRSLLSTSCLKNGKYFVDLFLSYGMSLMNTCLKTHQENVLDILKTLQIGTRILQVICTESKMKKDSSMSHVPVTRHSLNVLIYRVKMMLTKHGFSEAFWIGVLKNKNLDGEVLSTQFNNREEEEEESASEEGNMSDVQLDEEEEPPRKRRRGDNEEEGSLLDELETDYSASF